MISLGIYCPLYVGKRPSWKRLRQLQKPVQENASSKGDGDLNSPRACSSSTNKEGSALQAVIVWLTFVLNVSALYMSRVRRYVTTAEFKQLAKTLDIFRMVLARIYFTFVTVAVLL